MPGSCTLPLPGIMAAIVDETGHDVENGHGGILVIKRPWPAMIRTIWGDPERYKKSYYPEELGGKLYLAGDGAVRDKTTTYFTIMGRIDDVLNVSGHRLGTMEIESALVANPMVAEAAVVGRPDDMTGEAVCAFVVLKQARPTRREGEKIAKELRDWVGKEIGPIAKPKDIRFGDNLPKTRSGKIMRRLLRSIAKGEEITQDISTLENPAILERSSNRRSGRGGGNCQEIAPHAVPITACWRGAGGCIAGLRTGQAPDKPRQPGAATGAFRRRKPSPSGIRLSTPTGVDRRVRLSEIIGSGLALARLQQRWQARPAGSPGDATVLGASGCHAPNEPCAARLQRPGGESRRYTQPAVHRCHRSVPTLLRADMAWASPSEISTSGCVDVFITHFGAPDQLFRNNCDGTFTDVTGKKPVWRGQWHAGARAHVRSTTIATACSTSTSPTTSTTVSSNSPKCYGARSARDYCAPSAYKTGSRDPVSQSRRRHVRGRVGQVGHHARTALAWA